MKKVLLNFTHHSLKTKVSHYHNVIAKLTGNPTFTSPDPTLTYATALLNQLEAAIVSASDGGHTAISARHDCELATDKAFRGLALYVDKIADGDETKILSAGFQANNDRAPRIKVPLLANDGSHSGNVLLISDTHDKGCAYIFRVSKDVLPTDASGWTVVATVAQSKYEISGLVVGCYYYFDVAVVTPTGTTDFCAPVKKLVV